MKSKDRIIVIDLDDTLIDTARIKADSFRIARKNFGKSLRECISAMAYTASPRTPQGFAHTLLGSTNEAHEYAEKILGLFKKHQQYTYPDSKRFLKNMAGFAKIVLLTYGNRNYQKQKIAQSGLAHFFDAIIIARHKSKLHAIKRLKRAYDIVCFIDDSLLACRHAQSIGVPAIHITGKRKNSTYFTSLIKKMRALLN